MSPDLLPSRLETLFTEALQKELQPESFFNLLLPAVCQELQTDRCFLHLRQPQTRLYRVFCWRRHDEFPDLTTEGWQTEESWELDDPMFAAAMRCAPPIFVEDIETAGSDVLNVEFERQYLGHRALIHAHICDDGTLYGILQPCLFGETRVWSEADQRLVNSLLQRLAPIVVDYVATAS